MSSEQQLSTEPKFYKGGKNKARKALERVGAHALASADKLLFQNADNGEWGFYPLDAQAAQEAGERQMQEADAQATQEQLEPVLEAGPTNEDTVTPVDYDPEHPVQFPEAGAQDVPEDGANSDDTGPNVFGATMSQLTSAAPAAPAPVPRAASRTSYTIEKNRPEQNGIKRPSAGGLCRAVWDACDDLRASLNNGDANGPTIPDSKQIKAMADSKGWNRNNAMIEFYQWRKFNGITGRSAKKEAATPAPTPEVKTDDTQPQPAAPQMLPAPESGWPLPEAQTPQDNAHA